MTHLLAPRVASWRLAAACVLRRLPAIYMYKFSPMRKTASARRARAAGLHAGVRRRVERRALTSRQHSMLAGLLSALSLAAAWTVRNGGVAVSGSGAERVPFAELHAPVELYEDQSLDVSFSLPVDFQPTYVALRLLDPRTARERLVLAKSRRGAVKAVVPHALLADGMLDTLLRVHVLASGNGVPPLEQALFEATAYGSSARAAAPPPPPQYTFARQPEIFYTYRAPPRHASVLAASAFVAVIDSAFAYLLLSWAAFARSLRSVLPTKRAQLTTLALVVGIEAVFLLYFLYMSIFSVITALSVLLPLLFVAAAKL